MRSAHRLIYLTCFAGSLLPTVPAAAATADRPIPIEQANPRTRAAINRLEADLAFNTRTDFNIRGWVRFYEFMPNGIVRGGLFLKAEGPSRNRMYGKYVYGPHGWSTGAYMFDLSRIPLQLHTRTALPLHARTDCRHTMVMYSLRSRKFVNLGCLGTASPLHSR